MCGWTSACLTCPRMQVGTECQWAIKVTLYDVCKWLCNEMSPSVRKRRSVEVTQGWEEMVWRIMYLYEKVSLGYACVAGWWSVTMDVFPHIFFVFICIHFQNFNFFSWFPPLPSSIYTVQINPLSATSEGALAEHLHCSYRISWPTLRVMCYDLHSVCYFCSAYT